ncbi:uncharacterized protein LOC111804795 isoform X1 [Cucurbita pepo subsp. pepo]|uniref:uncharacterized protein LOC111804795 isoform X1 n=1 Tax=Cucurbita pepo subsp. pepo TaxID=3664 RepID=UPI000C9D6929|nr:uncharacterized protein LOC111804795 isoform X1 [Cucurbita pepo subsp. pepo]
MSVAFPQLSWWLRSGKHKEPQSSNGGSSLNASLDTANRETDTLKFSLVNGANISSSSRRVKRKWHSREERKIDREYDIVLVPSDGGCISGSESDDSDWSIGWSEPHGPGFQSDDDSDNSFAVLVPCYARIYNDFVDETKISVLSAVGNISDSFSTAESKKYMEQWLSSLQNC